MKQIRKILIEENGAISVIRLGVIIFLMSMCMLFMEITRVLAVQTTIETAIQHSLTSIVISDIDDAYRMDNLFYISKTADEISNEFLAFMQQELTLDTAAVDHGTLTIGNSKFSIRGHLVIDRGPYRRVSSYDGGSGYPVGQPKVTLEAELTIPGNYFSSVVRGTTDRAVSYSSRAISGFGLADTVR